MSSIKELAPFILKWEGGFVNHKYDRGGATNKGVTLKVWQKLGFDNDKDGDVDLQDLILITDNQATQIMAKGYWDDWQADKIENQAVANTLVDFAWGSGTKTSILLIQRLLGLKADGVVGQQTLKALNTANPKDLLEKIYAFRINFLKSIVQRNATQKVFLKGWLNRMNDLINYNKKWL